MSTWAHFAFYCASLALAGIWTFFLFQESRRSKPRKLLLLHRHEWQTLQDYGYQRKCRCKVCGEVALVRVVTLPKA